MDYKKLAKDFDRVKAKRSNFDSMYQVIGEYVAMTRQDFQGQPSNGEFLVDRIFDATGAFAATNAASSLLGMLWPGASANTFELAPPDNDDDEKNEANEKFYEKLNKVTYQAFDDPRANLAEALDEYMNDQMIFGTSGVGVELGEDSSLYFTPYGVKEIYPICGKGGRIVGFYLFFEWDVERTVAEYGLENCSERVKKAYAGGKLDDKVQVLFIVKPRMEKKAAKGKYAMPLMGVHMDYRDCHAMREDGYQELPVAIGRFRKLTYEDMGRSPAMNALPDVREANALREALIIATEKVLEMPKGVLSDGEFGGGYIDQSAGAVNVFNASGNLGTTAPVFDIGSPPNIPWAEKRLEKLEQSIAQHFMIDRLMDFNNDVQMTLGEARIRDQMKTASMVAMFNRQIQVIQKIIERGVALLFRAGKIGVVRGSEEALAAEARVKAEGLGEEVIYVPDGIAKLLSDGKEIYRINYKTKAALAYSAEQYMAILEMFNIVAGQAQIAPDMMKRIDYQKALKKLCEVRGISFMLRGEDEMKAMMQAEQEAMQQQQMLAGAQQVAEIADTAASAEQRMVR
jgi:hypothetical protein